MLILYDPWHCFTLHFTRGPRPMSWEPLIYVYNVSRKFRNPKFAVKIKYDNIQ